jgi:hypothetical protein
VRPASAQQAKVPRVGVLWFASNVGPMLSRSSFPAVFRQHLSGFGYVDGKTIAIDERFAESTRTGWTSTRPTLPPWSGMAV